MMGQIIKAGTGMCDLYLDEEKMISELSSINATTEDFTEVTNKNINYLLQDDDIDGLEENDYCDDDNFQFSI